MHPLPGAWEAPTLHKIVSLRPLGWGRWGIREGRGKWSRSELLFWLPGFPQGSQHSVGLLVCLFRGDSCSNEVKRHLFPGYFHRTLRPFSFSSSLSVPGFSTAHAHSWDLCLPQISNGSANIINVSLTTGLSRDIRVPHQMLGWSILAFIPAVNVA